MNARPAAEDWARRLHPVEVADMAAEGQHCDTRRCREPVTVYAWYRRAEAGSPEPLGHERFMCTAHGEAFAARHRLVLEDAPPGAEQHRMAPDSRPGATLASMSAVQIREHEEHGWHCDRQRCQRPARYLAGLTYAVRGAPRTRHVAPFLCTPHAERFAARHGLDMATVRPPEVTR